MTSSTFKRRSILHGAAAVGSLAVPTAQAAQPAFRRAIAVAMPASHLASKQ